MSNGVDSDSMPSAASVVDEMDELVFLCQKLAKRCANIGDYADKVQKLWEDKQNEFDPSTATLSQITTLTTQLARSNKVLMNAAEKMTPVELAMEQISMQRLRPNNAAGAAAASSHSRPVPPTVGSHASEQQQHQRALSGRERMNNPVASAPPLASPTSSVVSSAPSTSVSQPQQQQTLSVGTGFPARPHAQSLFGGGAAPAGVGTGEPQHQQPGTSAFSHRTHFGQSQNANLAAPSSSVPQPASSPRHGGNGLLIPAQSVPQYQPQQGVYQPPPPSQAPPAIQQPSMKPSQQQNGIHHDYVPSSTRPPAPPQHQSMAPQHLASAQLQPPPPPPRDNYHSSGTPPGDNKVIVTMQSIPAGTIWQEADIPIADHPSAFFVSNQEARVSDKFNQLAIDLNAYYSKPENHAEPLQNVAIGDFCAAQFSEDNLFYRARVVLQNSAESVLVVYIDYGNSESKPSSQIFPLLEQFAQLPAMTVACSLAQAFPHDELFWGADATEAFNRIVKNKTVTVQFQEKSVNQWPLHFVKILINNQPITADPQMAAFLTNVPNEQIAQHFNEKLTSMEYILYNVAVGPEDTFTGTL